MVVGVNSQPATEQLVQWCRKQFSSGGKQQTTLHVYVVMSGGGGGGRA